MTRRVLFDDSGLKISRAGVDVVSAPKSGLLFSSDWSQVGLFDRGSATIDWGSGATFLGSGSWSKSINLGETFDSIPLIAFTLTRSGVQMPIGDISGFTYSQTESGVDENDGQFYDDLRGWSIHGLVSTSKITLRASFFRPSKEFGTPIGNGTAIGFTIMRYNL